MAAAVAVAIAGCGGAGSPVSSASAPPPPALAPATGAGAAPAPPPGAPAGAPVPIAPRTGTGPAPPGATREVREAAALAALEGGPTVGALPILATDDGGPIDPGLSTRLAPSSRQEIVRFEAASFLPAGATPDFGGAGDAATIVARILRQHTGAVRACYAAALVDDPTLEGRIEITFTIGRDGAIAGARPAGTPIDAVLATCVASRLDGTSFPLPSEPMRVQVPISLQSRAW